MGLIPFFSVKRRRKKRKDSELLSSRFSFSLMKMGDTIEHQITRERQNTNDTTGLNKANNCAARAASIFVHFPDVFNKAKKKRSKFEASTTTRT